MKNNLSGFIFLMLLAATFKASAQDALIWAPVQETKNDANNGVAIIRGHGEVLPEGVIVRFVRIEGGAGDDYIITDTIANGQFKLEVPTGEDMTVGSLVFDYHAFPTLIRKLYLTPGTTVEIDAIDRYMSSWPVKSSVPEQAESDLYVYESKDQWIEYQALNIDYHKFKIKYDVYDQKTDSLSRLIHQRELELLKTRPIGMVWIDKAKDLAKMSDRIRINTEDLKSLYANLDDSIKNSPKGKAIYGYLYPGSPIKVDDKFPETEFHDLDGNVHRISEFQGKWCLVDFWNSGCSPCLRAYPELHELKEKYPETLEIVSMSMDTESIWRKASEKIPVIGHNWNEGKENYGVFGRLGTHTYPTYLVIAPDGTIKDLWVGYETGELKQKINSILSQ
ncbi:MAG: TlpA family protein disulfide reductase [Muribaculaceae bacterium]|nr:TlpA family protein disulfide reductase [Muribaculaceae bacterium]